MTPAVAIAGWVAAGAAGLLAVAALRRLQERMEAVARACHELRGPLTAARLGLSAGSSGAAPSPSRLRAVDAELVRAAVALDDLAEPRGGPPRLAALERLDVPALLRECVEAWQAVADAHGVALTLDWSGEATATWGDRSRLAQAVENLIANALEHGAGSVLVQGRELDGRARVTVSDEGPGLPAPVARLCRRGGRLRLGGGGRLGLGGGGRLGL
ncbi:MAG: ATP-binding protein, partial [Solirubrobacteraceae bacterium]